MLYPSINEIRKKADSRYTLVILAAQRARDLIDGKPSLLDEDMERPVSVAAHEIAEDYLTYRRPDPAEELNAEPAAEAAVEESAAESEASAGEDAAESETPVEEDTQEPGGQKTEEESEEEYEIDQEED